MLRIVQYLRERFPPVLAVFLSAGYAVYLVGILARVGGEVGNMLATIVLVGASFLFLLLRQRVLDEFKDFRHDSKNYVNRPLQRGLITKRQLAVMGVLAFAGEIGMVFLISPMALIYYIPVLIFSFLMAKEFFVGKWLKTRQTAYFISHQSVYILLAVWACLTFRVEFSFYAVLAVVAVVCVMAGAEIVRKYEVRKDARGKAVNDTYITMWGLAGARTALEFMIAVPGVIIAIIMNNIVPGIVALVGVIAIEALSRKQLYTRLIAGLVFVIQAILVVML